MPRWNACLRSGGSSLSAHRPPARSGLRRQEVGQQRAEQRIDHGAGPREVAGAAAGVVLADALGPIGETWIGRRERGGEIGDVAQAEVEPLRADRRKGMRRFADQHDAVRAGDVDGERAQQEDVGRRQQLDVAEQALRLLEEQRARSPSWPPSWAAFRTSRSSIQTRLARLPPAGTSVNGPVR